MHDDLLERRLRAALRTEGEQLPFTITPEELRRRLELQQRGRIGRPAMLLLAAAIGVGLVGVGAVASGWLNGQRLEPSQVPTAPIAVAPSVAPTPVPTILVLPPSLPSMEAFLAPLDPARIVRAQAVGPSGEPTSWPAGIDGPASPSFAPVSVAGAYHVLIACVGADVHLDTVHADRSLPVDVVPIACDGIPATRDVSLEAGDVIEIAAPDPASWRFALLAPDRPAPHATAIASAKELAAAAGRRLDNEAVSADVAPSYEASDPAPGEPQIVTSWSYRDGYRVAVSCAGPGPLTYSLRWPDILAQPVDVTTGTANIATTVECDGAAHVDVVRFPFVSGADVFISAPAGTAWRIVAAFEDPPITEPSNGDGWKEGFGLGPDLRMLSETDTSTLTFADPVRARIVVTCRGGTSVEVLAHDRDSGLETPFTAPCRIGETTASVGPTLDDVRDIDLTVSNHGSMWLIVSIQQAAGG
jgi:hypothetical protein